MELKQELQLRAEAFCNTSSLNCVSEQQALSPQLVGLRIYETPLLGFGDAQDPLFHSFLEEGVIGPHYRGPKDWMLESQSVIAFFLPFTKAVRQSNRADFDWPSNQWMHGRIDGQAFLNALALHLVEFLETRGYQAMVPSLAEGFQSIRRPVPGKPDKTYGDNSNWSERHAAYVCGLGTFSLTRGLITKKGVAGRFGSIVTNASIPPEQRAYDDPFAYCIRCGACIRHCPANAITMEEGKSNLKCGLFINQVLKRHHPYYGCGKCQVAVPCESRIPGTTGSVV